jgi:acetate kinase
MRILCVNAGSSSLKLSVLDEDGSASTRTTVSSKEGQTRLAEVLAELPEIGAVAHRIVHGGSTFTRAALVDDKLVAELRRLGELAPLHQGPALEAMTAVRRELPTIPMVACFDTAFHASLPVEARTYALPLAWNESGEVRRYGFHGLSYAYATRRAAELLERQVSQLRLVIGHLGSGASLCAVDGGRSVDTTMGFTPLEGLVMATRSGTVDPGAVLWLITHHGLDPQAVADTLEHRSGLLALAGTADMATVVGAGQRGEPAAALGLDVYVHRLRAAIAAMVAGLGGLDALVFTGGVGENAPTVRAAAAAGLGFLGVALDALRNDQAVGTAAAPEADITADGSTVRTLVVAAREDLEIARGVRVRLR